MKILSKIPAALGMAIMISLAGQGCFLDGSDGGNDISSAEDVMEANDSMVVFQDIVVLGDTWDGADTAAPDYDTNVTADSQVADEGNITGSDTSVGEDASASDTTVGYDAATDVTAPGDDGQSIRVECPHGDGDCPEGFLCADDKMGGRYCKPVGECSMDGVTSINSLMKELTLINTRTPVFIKVAATVKMATPTCSLTNCDADKPCCNTCFASLVIDDGPVPILIGGSQELPVGCSGNECTVQANCTPLTPDTEYVIWGTARMYTDGPQISIEGWCATSDIDAI